jgi:hypothetical protein
LLTKVARKSLSRHLFGAISFRDKHSVPSVEARGHPAHHAYATISHTNNPHSANHTRPQVFAARLNRHTSNDNYSHYNAALTASQRPLAT